MTTTMHVYCLHDRAGFLDTPVPLREYFARTRQEDGIGGAIRAYAAYADALLALLGHPRGNPDRVIQPAVLRRPEGGTAFLLPQRDGSRFLVSPVRDHAIDRQPHRFLAEEDGYREVDLSVLRAGVTEEEMTPAPASSTLHVYRLRRGVRLGGGGIPIDDYLLEAVYWEGERGLALALWRYFRALLAATTDRRWDPDRLGEPLVLRNPKNGGLSFRLPLKNGPTFCVSEAPMQSLEWYPQASGVLEHREVEA